ncbi:ribosome assembly RNA-binding protein YhbY [Thiococcus pfennigii]|jgi:RNA-binding protein|uniref:ribosome assembly RNA-binding protein YhbY n=1 Tax=Thiococcus pfennigii TaxID=1057 RepID=UPI0019041319|nr:ribosome assembly RNA-binding protein YhbY [Thiococcus pfennigii]MBK1701876.1 RNA-binding protein [Thiococcus pfennigii]MBK1730951.1 RNA-binding protein [Thiococcus pfennigii]
MSPSKPITERQRRWLKRQVHHLKPVVIVGQHGLSDAVLNEIGLALEHHELIKVKIAAGDRDERDALAAEIAERTAGALIDRIGHTAAFFRANPKKRQPLALPVD